MKDCGASLDTSRIGTAVGCRCGVAVIHRVRHRAFPYLAKAIGDPALITLATRMAIYAIAAASLNLILGYGGLVSFGHAAYFGVGGYVVGILYSHFVSGDPFLGFIPGTNQFLITLLAAMVVSGLCALVLGALSLRTSGFAIHHDHARLRADAVLPVRVAEGLWRRRRPDRAPPQCPVRSAIWPTTRLLLRLRGDRGRLFPAFREAGAIAVSALSSAASARTSGGSAAIGISTYQYKLAAFVIAGMGAGLAGALMANFAKFVSPDMLHWSKSGELMIMVIIGGSGTLFGPALGAVLLIGLETLLTGMDRALAIRPGPDPDRHRAFHRRWRSCRVCKRRTAERG